MYDEIFMDEYFDDAIEDIDLDMYDEYDIAEENTALKKFAVGALTGPLGILIGNIIHNSRVNKSVVIDRRMVCATFGDKEGNKSYNQAMNFFIKNDLLDQRYANADRVKYTDLTKKGKLFMNGYYSKLNEIQQFDMDKARDNSNNVNAQAVVQTVGVVADVGSKISNYAGAAAAREALAAIGIGLGAAHGALGFGAVCALTVTAFNVADTVKQWISSAKFKDVIQNGNEDVSIFDDEYFDYDDEASEDVDIFSEDYFDDAMEGNPDNKKKKQIYQYKQAGLSGADAYIMRAEHNNFGGRQGQAVRMARSVAKDNSSVDKQNGRRSSNPYARLSRERNLSHTDMQPGNRRNRMPRDDEYKDYNKYKKARNELLYNEAVGNKKYGRSAEREYHKS